MFLVQADRDVVVGKHVETDAGNTHALEIFLKQIQGTATVAPPPVVGMDSYLKQEGVARGLVHPNLQKADRRPRLGDRLEVVVFGVRAG